MAGDVFHALTCPLETGEMILPPDGRILLINMAYGPCASLFPATHTTCWNWNKSEAKCWLAAGYKVSPERPEGPFAAVFLALPQQRDSALGLLANAERVLDQGGVFVAAAPNDGGGRRLAGDVAPFCSVLQSASKHKCRIIRVQRAGLSALPEVWIERAALQYHPGAQMWTRPGVFSWDRIDQATRLLLPFIPDHQTGIFIDPGCGNGVITCDILRRNPGALGLVAYDIDFRATVACRRNVDDLAAFPPVGIFWEDFTASPKEGDADWVIMNPPYHQGKTEAIALGQEFITSAAKRLKPGGTLLMVANAHLPYEKILQSHFSAVEKCHEGGGFKIFKAGL